MPKDSGLCPYNDCCELYPEATLLALWLAIAPGKCKKSKEGASHTCTYSHFFPCHLLLLAMRPCTRFYTQPNLNQFLCHKAPLKYTGPVCFQSSCPRKAPISPDYRNLGLASFTNHDPSTFIYQLVHQISTLPGRCKSVARLVGKKIKEGSD